MTELQVPEVVEDPFREHYRELIRTSLLRAAEAETAHGRRGLARRRGAEPPGPAAAAPVFPVVVPDDDARFRSRLLTATRIVWLAAVVFLVCDTLAFGLESWATGIADIGVIVLTLVWFAVGAETSRGRQAAAVAAPVAAPAPEAQPDEDPVAPAGIDGVQVVPLRMGRDAGGHVTELLGDPALASLGPPARWQTVACRAGTLRGMHAHVQADELRIVVEGRVALVLKDLRPGSASEGRSQLVALSGDDYAAVVVPAGVAHGLFAETDALVLVALSCDEEKEHGCAWNDPGLGIEWPGEPRFLSERDRRAGPLEVLSGEIAASWLPLGTG